MDRPGTGAVRGPVLVTVTTLVAPLPTTIAGKVIGFGEAVNVVGDVVPVPLTGTVASTTPLPPVTTRAAVLLPPLVGENWTIVAQAPPAASVVVETQGGSPRCDEVVNENCAVSVPVIDKVGAGWVTPLVLVIVATTAPPLPTATFPTAIGDGVTLNEAVPSSKPVEI
jgi:hypothetical protein